VVDVLILVGLKGDLAGSPIGAFGRVLRFSQQFRPFGAISMGAVAGPVLALHLSVPIS
jgi:hypothetical protein